MVRRLRTAVLVVHGMGSQRPLETVRGIINAVWFDDDDHTKGSKKLWSHPEPSGVDIDLTVMTTNEIPGTNPQRVADFHELYWAHHLSETKAVAVLLWLFELGRRGPFFKTGMNGLWWCGAVYLCLMLLSVSLLATQGLVWITDIGAKPYTLVLVVGLMLLVAMGAGILAAIWYRYWALAALLVLAFGGMAAVTHIAWSNGLFHPGASGQVWLTWGTRAFLAPLLAFIAAHLLMGMWGRRAFALTYGLSLIFYLVFLGMEFGNYGWERVLGHLRAANIAWALPSHASTMAAFVILAVYLMINAAFLQPYLGDAARYFRNSPANVAVRRAIRKDAVDTLEQLHRSRDYDRIVVVAHSLGTVVAYDMLRAYYSRIRLQMKIDKTDEEFAALFDGVDGGALECTEMRRQGRRLIGKFAEMSQILKDDQRQGLYKAAKGDEVDAWLVTDFVTLGSPLTHAHYLMTNEKDGGKIEQKFQDRIREREFPVCPPYKDGDDGLLSYTVAGETFLHHGGMFGMTRWTNLYFPIYSIFWGDAIGGPVREVFGGCVKDVAVSTKKPAGAAFFTHLAYWRTDYKAKRAAPHLASLIEAIDLPDRDKAPPQPEA